MDPLVSTFNREKIVKEVKLQPGGSGELSLNYFEELVSQFNHVEEVFNQFSDNASSTNDQILASLQMLEFEKNKIKGEVGCREEVRIQESFDAASVWQTVSMMSKALHGSSESQNVRTRCAQSQFLTKEKESKIHQKTMEFLKEENRVM